MKKPVDYETAVKRLEEIVRQLERGDGKLEDAMKLFQEGTELVKMCSKQLDDAEQQVVKLMKGADGAPLETEFADE